MDNKTDLLINTLNRTITKANRDKTARKWYMFGVASTLFELEKLSPSEYRALTNEIEKQFK